MLDKSCFFHSSYSSCHFAFSRTIDDADKGAPSPNRPRRDRSKSPVASPCRYSSGNSCPTSFDLRLKKGIILLSNCSSVSRTRGRRTVIVPFMSDIFFGFPYPLRYPTGPSTTAILSDFLRPRNLSTSSSRISWIYSCAFSRTISSSVSYVALDPFLLSVILFFMVVFPFFVVWSQLIRIHRLLFYLHTF